MARRALNSPTLLDDEIDDMKTIEVDHEDVTAITGDYVSEEKEILAEFGSPDNSVDFYFKVYRFLERNKDRPYLFTGTIADMPVLDRIRDEYGSGKYEIRFFRDNKLYRRLMPTVELPRGVSPMHERPKQSSDVAAAMAPVMESLRTQSDILRGFMERLTSAPPPPPVTVAQGPSMLEMMQGMVGLMVSMKELVGGQKSETPNNTIEMFLKGIELAKDLNSDSAGNKTIMEVIGDVLTKTPLLENLGAAANAPVPQQVQQPQRVAQLPSAPVPQHPQAPRPQNQPAPQPSEDPQAAAFRMQLDAFIDDAKHSVDPNLAADEILARPHRFPPEMVQQLGMPGAMDWIVSFHPPVGPYRAWFDLLIKSLTEEAQEDDIEGDSASGSGPSGASPAHVSERRRDHAPTSLQHAGRPGWRGDDVGDYEALGESGDPIA